MQKTLPTGTWHSSGRTETYNHKEIKTMNILLSQYADRHIDDLLKDNDLRATITKGAGYWPQSDNGDYFVEVNGIEVRSNDTHDLVDKAIRVLWNNQQHEKDKLEIARLTEENANLHALRTEQIHYWNERNVNQGVVKLTAKMMDEACEQVMKALEESTIGMQIMLSAGPVFDDYIMAREFVIYFTNRSKGGSATHGREG